MDKPDGRKSRMGLKIKWGGKKALLTGLVIFSLLGTGMAQAAKGAPLVNQADYETSIAIGSATDSQNSYLLGLQSKVGGQGVAIGDQVNWDPKEIDAIPPDAVAIGFRAKSYGGVGATALGAMSKAKGNDTVAIGMYAESLDPYSVSIGNSAKVYGVGGGSSVALGYEAQVGSIYYTENFNRHFEGGTNITAIGAYSKAYGSYSLALGALSQTGELIKLDDGNWHIDSNAGLFATAIGYKSSASMRYSVALGGYSRTDYDFSKAMNSWTFHGKKYDFAGTAGENNGVVSVGSQGKERIITYVAPGRIAADSIDAINGSQLYYAIQALDKDVKAGDQTVTVTPKSNDSGTSSAKSFHSILKEADSAADDTSTTPTVTYEVTVNPTTLSIDGDQNLALTNDYANTSGSGRKSPEYHLTLKKDLTLNSVTITGGPTLSSSGIDMKDHKITNVSDGEISAVSKDAVNGSQLYATNQNISNLGGEVNKLGTRVNRVGANAAALAALHPLDFDPDDKWDFAAGYGNYKNANAAAIGAYYRPNEDTMFSVGGSFGGGENMVNAGISVKLGQGNHVSTSRVAMAKEIKDLRKDVADLKAVVNQQSALIDKLTGVNAGQLSGSDDLFPDVPANHWAYEYVTKLKQAGILTGYPDGNFAGDRMMTRYEFAAIVYRAIMAGAAANPNLNKDGTLDRLAKEFSGEMKYIRIDTIRKDRNGKPTIQRVRVIKEEENKA